MRIRPAAFGILVIALFAGTVGVAMAAGAWQTTGRSGAGMGAGDGSGSGRSVPATIENATQVKGWMAVGDVAAATGVALPDLLAAFGLPADTPPDTALKDLESESFSVAALREWLDARDGGAIP
jgi:hypothetical protein